MSPSRTCQAAVVLGRSTATDTYSMTFVKLDDSAAKIGDVLEIRADSPSTLVGIRPVQHVVTSDDVIDSRIEPARPRYLRDSRADRTAGELSESVQS